MKIQGVCILIEDIPRYYVAGDPPMSFRGAFKDFEKSLKEVGKAVAAVLDQLDKAITE